RHRDHRDKTAQRDRQGEKRGSGLRFLSSPWFFLLCGSSLCVLCASVVRPQERLQSRAAGSRFSILVRTAPIPPTARTPCLLHPPRRFVPALEMLEDRLQPAVTVTTHGSTLLVAGDNHINSILIVDNGTGVGSDITVRADGGVFTPSGIITV